MHLKKLTTYTNNTWHTAGYHNLLSSTLYMSEWIKGQKEQRGWTAHSIRFWFLVDPSYSGYVCMQFEWGVYASMTYPLQVLSHGRESWTVNQVSWPVTQPVIPEWRNRPLLPCHCRCHQGGQDCSSLLTTHVWTERDGIQSGLQHKVSHHWSHRPPLATIQ